MSGGWGEAGWRVAGGREWRRGRRSWACRPPRSSSIWAAGAGGLRACASTDTFFIESVSIRKDSHASAALATPRSQIGHALTEALADELTVACAPASFGKTALLADWARRTARPVAWLSLDTADNDPVRFWRHVTAVLGGVPATAQVANFSVHSRLSVVRAVHQCVLSADCALPSPYEACHEDPYKPGGAGFATWPATKWPWFGELAERGYLVAAVHRGKNLLVTGEVARLLDPICRAEIKRMRAADRGWGRLLDHLAAAGPSSIDDLRTELGLRRQELKSLRAPLERCGAIVSRTLHVPAGQGHQPSSALARWDPA